MAHESVFCAFPATFTCTGRASRTGACDMQMKREKKIDIAACACSYPATVLHLLFDVFQTAYVCTSPPQGHWWRAVPLTEQTTPLIRPHSASLGVVCLHPHTAKLPSKHLTLMFSIGSSIWRADCPQL
ncbi:hypothetical protein BaRGS_00001454 [Batillaria attramentaria]|uniref:Uncharacterized protein n=1 Tax=Batillaria attramentaria TaxID=370345 RepID=A0ABD0M7X1_9CAEN